MFSFKSFFLKKFRIKKHLTSLSILNRKEKFYKPLILILPSLLLITLFIIIPFIITITDAFKVQTGFLVSDVSPGIDNFKTLLRSQQFQIGLRNSIIYSLMALPLSLTCSILISSAIAHVVKKWARGFWQTLFFLPYVTSSIAVAVTFSYLFASDAGILNAIIGKRVPWLTSASTNSWTAFFAILINGIWGSLAFQILILTTAMLSVSPVLYKSASIDGAYKLKQFFSVTLPSIRKTISFLITIGIIGGIKVFPLALFNNSPTDAVNNGGATIMLFVYKAVAEGNFYLAGAASLILFVLGVFVSFSVRKLVAVSFRLSTTLGVKRVSRKINSKTPFTKKVFKF
ncbi:carbohydrate ABC transporter permease [Mycoplasma sp. 128]